MNFPFSLLLPPPSITNITTITTQLLLRPANRCSTIRDHHGIC
jgi:hypothetical protein